MAVNCRQKLFLGIFVSSLIFHHHGTILANSSLHVYPVDSCPENETAVKDASHRLNCSYGFEFNKNEYHCVPASDISHLVEFCYDKTSGLIEDGNCMVLEKDTLDNRPCLSFTKGCPNESYTSEKMFKFPACARINRNHTCYMEDLRCQTSLRAGKIEPGSSSTRDVSFHVLIPFLAVALITAFAFMVYTLLTKKRYQNEKKVPQGDEEAVSLLNIDPIGYPGDEEAVSLLNIDPIGYPGDEEAVSLLNIDPIGYLDDEEEFQRRLQKHLDNGYEEICPISQIMIFGENGVGKTTLLYRLQGKTQKEVDGITSTRGIECYVKKDSFLVADGSLEKNLEGVSDLLLHPGPLSTDAEKKEINDEGVNEKPGNKAANNDDGKSDNMVELRHELAKNQSERQKQDSFYEKLTKDRQNKVSDKYNEQTRNKTESNKTESSTVTKAGLSVPFGDIQEETAGKRNKEVPSVDTNEVETHLLPLIHTHLGEKENISKQSRTDNRNRDVLNVLDFAGQGVYYASHQTFIREDAIYMIVVDTSREIEKKKEKDSKLVTSFLCDRHDTTFSDWSQKDYFKYWMNTIAMHGGQCKNHIFIGTHRKTKR